MIKGFFDSKTLRKFKLKKFQLIIHSHLFEHIYDINNFLSLVHKQLDDKGLHIFSVPNIKKFILDGSANGMNFEHPYFLSEDLLDFVLKKNHFLIKKKQYFKKHSIMYVTEKINKTNKYEKLKFSKYRENKKIFDNLYFFWKNEILKINKNLSANKDNKVFLFGAHIFSQILIFNDLDLRNIQGVIDNDKEKQGYYLYGTALKVYEPIILFKLRSPIIILRAGQYNSEIKKQLNRINNNIKYI